MIGAALLAAAAQGAQAATLDVVRQRGAVTCGTTTGFAGFSAPDAQGKWQGLDVDLCRAVAAAVFGDADKIKVVPLNSQQRFTALQSGEVDVLTRNTTVTQQRDTALGIIHAGINFYDGQGFLVPKSLGVKSAKDINGATICLQTGTSNENTLADWARANHVTYKPVVIETFNEVVNAFAAGRCDVFSTDASGLASIRISSCRIRTITWCCRDHLQGTAGPLRAPGRRRLAQHRALVAVRHDRGRGIRHHLQERGRPGQNSANPNIKRILGVTAGSANLGLDEKWAYQIVKQVGNYGESFERHVGQGSPLKIQRGLNAQWTQGGLMYCRSASPPRQIRKTKPASCKT